MLSSETKQKINNCRDYLVGKIPDPKWQIEQITNALIYKFMSDQDKLSQDLWGKESFFIGEYQEYNWPKLFDSTKTNEERANLYIKGIEKLSEAKHLPELFRQIFKDAYIPFRAPNTIIHFISEINKFDYNHSEELGNAFEYLLQIMGSQWNAGQFRTPRHIIEFVVDAVDPKADDTIYDPACGTAGFLISAYKHILENNPKLTPSERLKLSGNISGIDIDPGMAKIARVNLFLHGFKSPHINEWDTLSDKPLWGKKFDVFLANPPFMTPKGWIKPHDGYTINSTKAEVLFTSYIAQHLKLGGRAGIIVPEGIIFQAATAYKKLRKMLIEEKLLYAVVSLPWGIFQPYSGVKTSVLLLDRKLAAKSDKILFAKIEQDGFSMSAQRKTHSLNDIPEILSEIQNYKTSLENEEEFVTDNFNVFAVEKSKIAEGEEYNLSGERYREAIKISSKFNMYELWDLCDFKNWYAFQSQNYSTTWYQIMRITNVQKWFIDWKNPKFYPEEEVNNLQDFILSNNDLLISLTWNVGRVWIVKSKHLPAVLNQRVAKIENDQEKVLKKYLFHLMNNNKFEEDCINLSWWVAQKNLWTNSLKKYKIPLPTLDIQKQIVDELDSYQKIIDGAKQIIDNYKPTIKIDKSWEIVKLDDVCDIQWWWTPSRNESNYWGWTLPWITAKYFSNDHKIVGFENITQEWLDNSSSKIAPKGSTIIITRVSVWKFAYADRDYAINQDLTCLIPSQKIHKKFLFLIWSHISELVSKNAIWIWVVWVNRKFVKDIEIPLPSIEIQKEVVAEIEREQRYVEGAKELIKIYEQKIEVKVNEVWGGNDLDV